MKATTLSSVLACLVLAASVASAQTPTSYYTPPRPVQSPLLVQHHASTFEEGYLRGWADVRRATGEYNYNTSLANVNQQEAIRRSILNKKLYTQVYFESKEINRQHRANARGKRVTPQQVTEFNRLRLPARLTAYEYQAATGTLHWPALLQDNFFAPERAAIDKAMASRTPSNSGIGTASQREVKQLAAQIESKIRSLGSQLSSAERIAARKFLKSLTYEAQFPVLIDKAGLAAK